MIVECCQPTVCRVLRAGAEPLQALRLPGQGHWPGRLPPGLLSSLSQPDLLQLLQLRRHHVLGGQLPPVGEAEDGADCVQ